LVFCTFFQLYVFTDELKADGFFYIYDNVSVVLFFQFRIAAIAVLTYALSVYISSVRQKNDELSKKTLIRRAENFTILGALLFLCGEFSGSVWAQLAYGDAWHWSKNFFTSAIIFLLALFGGHFSSLWFKNKNRQIIFSVIPLILILIIFLT